MIKEKTFFLDQYGCSKNQVDAEILIGILYEQNWQKTTIPEEAQLIIINSCGFITPAKEESLNAVFNARTAYPNAKIVLAGCLSERYGKELSKTLSEVDFFFGNGDLHCFTKVLEKLFPKKLTSLQTNPQANNELRQTKKQNKKQLLPKPVEIPLQKNVCTGNRPELLSFPKSTYIKITEGCDNWCSYCAIPIIRGSLRSRLISDIVSEIKNFLKQDVFEFNLIGQDLGSYNADGKLKDLLEEITKIKGNFRIRLLYIHPDFFPLDILPIIKKDKRILPYFDIPFQSGDNEIIKAMNRKGSFNSYLNLVKTIKKELSTNNPIDEPIFRTTFLVGFPGESKKAFNNTKEFLTKLQPTWSGAFAYSKEEGTASYKLKSNVSNKKAKKRVKTLQDLQIEITKKELTKFIGAKLEILIEELIKEEDLAIGRAWFQAPEVDGAVVVSYQKGQKDLNGEKIQPGSLVKAKVVNLAGIDLSAVLVEEDK